MSLIGSELIFLWVDGPTSSMIESLWSTGILNWICFCGSSGELYPLFSESYFCIKFPLYFLKCPTYVSGYMDWVIEWDFRFYDDLFTTPSLGGEGAVFILLSVSWPSLGSLDLGVFWNRYGKIGLSLELAYSLFTISNGLVYEIGSLFYWLSPGGLPTAYAYKLVSIYK